MGKSRRNKLPNVQQRITPKRLAELEREHFEWIKGFRYTVPKGDDGNLLVITEPEIRAQAHMYARWLLERGYPKYTLAALAMAWNVRVETVRRWERLLEKEYPSQQSTDTVKLELLRL